MVKALKMVTGVKRERKRMGGDKRQYVVAKVLRTRTLTAIQFILSTLTAINSFCIRVHEQQHKLRGVLEA